MDRLPLELLIKILISLPINIIIQCSTVCKAWNRLIKTPNFRNIHSKHQPRDLMLIKTYNLPDNQRHGQTYNLYCDDDKTFNMYIEVRVDPKFNPLIHKNYQIIGICNGVICGAFEYFLDEEEIYLWNPTIRKCLEIPTPGIPSSKVGRGYCIYGFGFDPNSDDFKVVRMVGYNNYLKYGARQLLPLLDIKLYSMRSASWRNITRLAKDIKYGIPKESQQAFLNGAAHWFGAKKESYTSDTTIISFDFSDELFYCIETPSAISFRAKPDFSIIAAVVQESLALIEHCPERCIIWVMGAYGDSSSWAKRFDIVLLDDFDRIIGVRKNGELLIQMRCQIFSFEHKNAEGKERSIRRELDLHVKDVFRQGQMFENFISYSGDDFCPNPESGLKYLACPCNFTPPARCERFEETLALLETTTSSRVGYRFEPILKNIAGDGVTATSERGRR